MEKVTFDFTHISDLATFYDLFRQKFRLTQAFGNNLDALWDTLTGGIALPVEIEFINLTPNKKRRFGVLLLLLEEAEVELEGEFYFNIR